MSDPGFSQRQDRFFEVRYSSAQDMDPANQAPLIAAIEQAGATGPVGILFQVSDSLFKVGLDVPAFWLGVVARPELQMSAMAIVSRSLGVQFAAKGFRFSNKLRGIPLEVETFDDLEPARAWLLATRDRVAARGRQRA